jgi:hypothetical protein
VGASTPDPDEELRAVCEVLLDHGVNFVVFAASPVASKVPTCGPSTST